MKKLIYVVIIVIILALGITFLLNSGNSNTSTTPSNNYTGQYMSFQYPTGWNITEMNENQTVELNKSSDWIQVLLIGTAQSSDGLQNYTQEDIDLGDMYKSQGTYYNNVSNTSYQVFTGNYNNTAMTIYLFNKNGSYFEVRGTGNLDAYDEIVATIH